MTNRAVFTVFAAGVAFVGLALTASSARAGTVTVEQHGGRNVRVFVPTKAASPTPMVVMLHGCTQSPDDFAGATQMDALAEQEGFVVAYPEQASSVIATQCYQWYLPAHQARDAGEPKSLADGTNEIAQAQGVDAQRVYVAGISAGAAMSVILGATYPDVFTAIGVVAGIEYKGGTSIADGYNATQSGGPDPDGQGDLAHTAMGTHARVVPTFVVQGTADGVVAKVNGDQVTEQWRRTNTLVLGDGAIDAAISAPGSAGYTFTRFVQRSKANGASVIEYYVVDGMGHAWPGGKSGGSFSDPMGPNATSLLWAFFKGRTLAAPLSVPPAVVPGATDGGTDGGGTKNPNDGGPGDPGSTSGSSATSGSGGSGDGSSSSSGGCSVVGPSSATQSPSSAPLALGGGLVVAALALCGLRRRRLRRRGPSSAC